MEMPAEIILDPASALDLTHCNSPVDQAMQKRASVPADQPEAIVLPAEWHIATLAG